MKFRIRWYTIALLAVGLALIIFGGRMAYSWYFPGDMAEIVSVIDGDTLLLDNGEIVRLIGIDSPEKDQKFYYEAKDKLSSLVLHNTIRLERDKENKDQYGRLLRYVYIPDESKQLKWTGTNWAVSGFELFVNAEMVSTGYATSYPYPPNIKYVEIFDWHERTARLMSVGMFAEEDETPTQLPATTPGGYVPMLRR